MEQIISKKYATIAIGLVAIIVAIVGIGKCASQKGRTTDPTISALMTKAITDPRGEIVGKLQNSADLVTTEMQIRTIAEFSQEGGNFNFNPSTWDIHRIGRVDVVLPVNITIKYGYDLSNMSADNVKVDDKTSEVWVYLPEPKILESSYDANICQDSLFIITTGFRKRPTNAQIANCMKQVYDSTVTTFSKTKNAEMVERNAQKVFENILKKVNGKNQTVHIAKLKDKK